MKDIMTDTQLAQMALSAIVRSEEKVDIITLSEVLRGQNTRAVKALCLNQIKTFGVGRDWSKEAWFYMLIQMLQQGLFIIDYKGNYALKVTEDGHRVLKNEFVVTFEDHDKSNTESSRRWSNRTATLDQSQQPSDSLVGTPTGLSFKRNGVKVFIEPDICEAIAWKEVVQSIGSKIYWNYQGEMWLNINKYIPAGIENRDKVKSRLLDVVASVYNVEISGDSLHLYKKEDHDINGEVVQSLKLPFEECLSMMRDFLEKNGFIFFMNLDAQPNSFEIMWKNAKNPIKKNDRIILNTDDDYFDLNDNTIKKKNGNIIFTSIKLPQKLYTHYNSLLNSPIEPIKCSLFYFDN